MSHRVTLYPSQERPGLDRLIKEACARFDALSPEQQREHRRAQRKSQVASRKSWVVGEMLLAHPDMSREHAEKLWDELGL